MSKNKKCVEIASFFESFRQIEYTLKSVKMYFLCNKLIISYFCLIHLKSNSFRIKVSFKRVAFVIVGKILIMSDK